MAAMVESVMIIIRIYPGTIANEWKLRNIPNYPNYRLNFDGLIVKETTNRILRGSKNKTVTLFNDGNKQIFKIDDLVKSIFGNNELKII